MLQFSYFLLYLRILSCFRATDRDIAFVFFVTIVFHICNIVNHFFDYISVSQ